MGGRSAVHCGDLEGRTPAHKAFLGRRDCSPPVPTRPSSASQVSNRSHRGFPYLWVRFMWDSIQVSEVPYLHTGLLGSVMGFCRRSQGFSLPDSISSSGTQTRRLQNPAIGTCYVRRSIVVFWYAVRRIIPLEMAPSIALRQYVN